jgi:hypothetical protein
MNEPTLARDGFGELAGDIAVFIEVAPPGRNGFSSHVEIVSVVEAAGQTAGVPLIPCQRG